MMRVLSSKPSSLEAYLPELGLTHELLDKSGASDNVARLLREMIFSGRLTPGERLPSGVELAASLGISVVTLRVALKSLESVGFVTASRGGYGGTRISESSELKRCWSDWVNENAADLESIFELRSTIETRIASLAAERRSDEDLRRIETANGLLSGPDPSLLPWNVAFHHAVADAAHSRHLAEAMVSAQGKLFLPIDLASYDGQVDALREAHAAILTAIRARDADAASAAVREDLAGTEAFFRRWLRQHPASRS
jgi:GntR family transcriptional regulator, transcriptional repressor for pyruvate dehydrogenase complex